MVATSANVIVTGRVPWACRCSRSGSYLLIRTTLPGGFQSRSSPCDSQASTGRSRFREQPSEAMTVTCNHAFREFCSCARGILVPGELSVDHFLDEGRGEIPLVREELVGVDDFNVEGLG